MIVMQDTPDTLNTADTASSALEQRLSDALDQQQLSPGVRYQLQERRRLALSGQRAALRASWLHEWTFRRWSSVLAGVAVVGLVGVLTLLPAEPEIDLAQLQPEMLVDPLLLEEMDMLLWLSELPEDAI